MIASSVSLDPMALVILGALIAAIVAAMALLMPRAGERHQVGKRVYREEDLLRSLEKLTGLRAFAAPEDFLDGAKLQGKLSSGRGARIDFFHDAVNGRRHSHVRFGVGADEAPQLEVARNPWMLEGTPRAVRIGDPAFDDEFRVATGQPEAAAQALASVKDTIERVFDRFHVERLSLGEGKLEVELPRHTLSIERYPDLLRCLDEAARRLDRVGVHVHVLGGDRHAVKGADGGARCGYCHATVTGREPDLVACERCSTILHDGCWKELRRCPVLGCRGHSPERARGAHRA